MWEYVLDSIKKQAKGARQDSMRHRAKIEGFVVSLRYRQGQEEEQNKGSAERRKGSELEGRRDKKKEGDGREWKREKDPWGRKTDGCHLQQAGLKSLSTPGRIP